MLCLTNYFIICLVVFFFNHNSTKKKDERKIMIQNRVSFLINFFVNSMPLNRDTMLCLLHSCVYDHDVGTTFRLARMREGSLLSGHGRRWGQQSNPRSSPGFFCPLFFLPGRPHVSRETIGRIYIVFPGHNMRPQCVHEPIPYSVRSSHCADGITALLCAAPVNLALLAG